MTFIRDSQTNLAANVGSAGLAVSAITTSGELTATVAGLKNSILTSQIAITTLGALLIITYTGDGLLFIADNAVVLNNQTGTATGAAGILTIQTGGEEGVATFSDVSGNNDYLNWDAGNTRAVNFTARQGNNASTIVNATHSLAFPIAATPGAATNTIPFVLSKGATYSLSLTTLPAGITATDVTATANVYEQL